MTIYGHGVLWDPKRNKPAARFVGGELETNDSRVIELAKAAGFITVIEGVDGEEWEPTKDDLLEIADRHGVTVDKRWGVERLKQAVL